MTLEQLRGNETITITIRNGEKALSTSYNIKSADWFNGTKGEYHLMKLDFLVERFRNCTATTHNATALEGGEK
jgi:hypothetical protein